VNPQRAVVDSSGWIEVFTNGPLTDRFLAVLETEASLVVPAISILEVFKWVLREHSEAQAIQAAAVMQRGMVVDLDSRLAIAAAQLSHML
jgi:PIN domain nuclease of toxin-antitoxin system